MQDNDEQYGRRMNVRVEGLAWEEGETDDQLETQILKKFADQGVPLQPSDIIRMHRSSKPKNKDNRPTTKQAIIKLSNWKAREKLRGWNKEARRVEKETKVPQLRVNNDMTKRRLTLLDAARSRIKTGLARQHSVKQIEEGLPDHQNVFAYCNIQSDLRIRARGNVHSFNSLEDLDEVLTKLFPEIENSARPTADQLIQGRAQAVAEAAALTGHQWLPRRVCVGEIIDKSAWDRVPTNVYAGRYHQLLTSENFGNPFRVDVHGRDKALDLYHTNLELSDSQRSRIASATEVACHCKLSDRCHADILIATCCK